MRFWTELRKLAVDIEKLMVCDNTIKAEVLDILKVLFGENSREYKVVKQTTSSATIVKVLNHIFDRAEVSSNAIAVNM